MAHPDSSNGHGLLPDAPVQGRPRHLEVSADLSGWLATPNEPQGVADLEVGEGLPARAEVLGGGPPYGHRVSDPLPFDL